MLKLKVLGLAMLASFTLLTACQEIPDLPGWAASSETDTDPMPTVFHHGDPEPAMAAFRIVTEERGWADADIEAWAPFVQAVMKRESGFCPNVRRGAQMAGDGASCEIARQGTHSDSGFGQVLAGYPWKRGWVRGGTSWRLNENASYLCPEEGLCEPDDVIATPRASMTALVALIERSGRQPWCYTSRLRSGAVCRLAP